VAARLLGLWPPVFGQTALLPSCTDYLEILGASTSYSPQGFPDQYIVCFAFIFTCFYKLKEGKMGGACNTNGGKRGANRDWVGKTEGKKPLGKT